ncbi:MAG TPA: TonB-dependent receptor [Myxococcales bacterium]
MRLRSDGRQPAALAILACCCLLSAPRAAGAYEGVIQGSVKKEEPPPPKAPTLTKAPELLQFVEAEFPEEAAKEQLTGEVGLLVDIGEDGKVTKAEVVAPAGHGFDEAAAAAVRKFLFSPAELDGKPAQVRIQYTYKFVMKEAPPPAVEVGPGARQPQAPESLKGRAIQRASRKPLVGANVHVDETGEDTMTDSDGAFSLHLFPGKYTVRLAAAGHHPFKREEIIDEGKLLEVTYYLMPVSFGLFQTVVRAERDKREATQRTLQREELQKIPGTLGDPIRVVQNMPGVARAPYLSGNIIVRGAAPSETGTYLDSVEIPLLYHFFGGPSVVNPEFLDRLDFLPGGFGPRYGRATGGIIDAFTRRGAADQAHGNLKVDLIDAAAFVEVPLGERFSVAAAARRSYIDAILPAFMPNDPVNGSVSVLPVYWDYQVRADYGKKGDKHQLTLMAFGSDDRATVAQKGGQKKLDLAIGFRTNFHRVRAGWAWRDGDMSNVFIPWFGRDDTGGELSSGGDSPFHGSGISWSWGARDEFAYAFGGGHVARLGIDLKFDRGETNFTAPGFIADYRTFPGAAADVPLMTFNRVTHQSNWGFYNEWELKLGDRIVVMPGVRLEEYWAASQLKTSVDPRLIARARILDKTPIGISTTLKGTLGHYSMPLGSLDVDKELGNPNLVPPKAFQASLGVEHKITDVIDIDVTGFYNRRYDLVVGSDRMIEQPDGSVKPEINCNDGLGRAYGIEVLLRHNLTEHFFGWLAYTFSRTEERRRGNPTYVPGSYDEPHILTAVAQYRWGNGWSVGARFRLVSGRPFTSYNDSVYDADSNGYRGLTAAYRSERNPVFHQLDLRADKEFLFDLWKFGVYLDIQNVYNAQNIESWQWDYRYHERVGVPGLPILPTLGLKGSF